MRELCINEIKMTSGAGIIKDDPKLQSVMNDFNTACAGVIAETGPVLAGSVAASQATVSGAVSIMDAAWTNAFNNVMNLLKF